MKRKFILVLALSLVLGNFGYSEINAIECTNPFMVEVHFTTCTPISCNEGNNSLRKEHGKVGRYCISNGEMTLFITDGSLYGNCDCPK